MSVKIWYLYHSGFAVQTPGHFLVFDYWRNTPKNAGLDGGVIDPAALREQDVVVFASHRHGDHFQREILHWHKAIPKLRIVLSDDIKTPTGELAAGDASGAPGVWKLGPGSALEQPDFSLLTLASNDEGVAFVVDVDGLRIYHAGDLNWWHWEGEPEDYNADMAQSYQSQIALLAGKPIDLAFVPVDPRLEKQYAWGIDHLMRTADVRHVVPMHFGDDSAVVHRLLNDPVSADYRDRVAALLKRGDSVEI